MLTRLILLLTLIVIGSAGAAEPQGADRTDFAFVQISDMHISPHLARTPAPGAPRGAEAIAWICEQVAREQTLTPFGITTPAPAFGLATGDLTEYGVIDDTWEVFEQVFSAVPFPLYVLAGNHDNTWVAMYHVLRKRHGGENYSFDKHGIHFACICSASPQEPVPTIDAKTRAWLKRDLAAIAPGTPVILALHHPLYSNEFANPVERDTLMDMLRDYNVVLMLYGHGHSVDHRRIDGIDGMMGGSTFGKNAGYAVISIQDDKLRAAYHYHKMPTGDDQAPTDPGWRAVLEKPIRRSAPKRKFAITEPAEGAIVTAEHLRVVVEPVAERGKIAWDNLEVSVDGNKVDIELEHRPTGVTFEIPCAKLTRGWHLLTLRLKAGDKLRDLRTLTFAAVDNPQPWVWREQFPAAIKAGPRIVDDKIIVARTDGLVCALDHRTGDTLWSFETSGEILGTPAWSGEVLVFGSGDGHITALNDAGEQVWTHDAGLPVYGVPLIAGETVYIGDNGGRLHALDLHDGSPRWTFERADYAIELQPCVWGELVVFGAWDGYVYAVSRESGELAWKSLGPKSSAGRAVTYYAPADCGPVAIDDKLFVCDRGYMLAAFDPDGKRSDLPETNIAAITTDANASCVYARATDDHVCRLSRGGEVIWKREVPAGRFPIPPTCAKDAVYVCSNRGVLSALDAENGNVRYSFQVTPGFYVMAPVAVDDDGMCYVAGMDGSVTALRAAGR